MKIVKIAGREFGGFFSSPVAFIFFGAFLAVTLFIFFWVETFFARNIADIRPLFQWLPVLLIFLSAAITMRMWSEERRAGTMELLLTSPVRLSEYVAGKFLACLGLIVIALLMTLPLPVTVSFMGSLDWGPVIGGYVAACCLAASYIAAGLFVSARSSNQIVSLIVTSLLCGLLYLPGADAVTGLFGSPVSEYLKMLGSGSRFDAITRGIIDLRDLYYYLGLVGFFLTLNVYSLERLKWAGNPSNDLHRRRQLLTGLVAANFIAANFWLAPVTAFRIDLTQGSIYSISDVTRSCLAQLREPLLIRGYFSAQTHPLLAPLVPRLQDLLEEYSIAGRDRVRVEIIDPIHYPEMEQEAGEKYGIRPVPFQTASKYQASVTNSYFDILVKYGDQYEVLGFRDLIEVKAGSETDIEVDLRNPEFDITRAIRKVLYAYQGSGNLFGNITAPVTFRGYISTDEKLPGQLVELKKSLTEILEKLKKESSGKFTAELADPDEQGGALARKIEAEYGFRPMVTSLLDTESFWFYMVLKNGDRTVQVPLPDDLEKSSLERAVQSALKRFARGFLKTIALHTPRDLPSVPQLGFQRGGKQFNWLRTALQEEHTVVDTDLKSGQIPAETDLLLILAPEGLDRKQLFALDQFLMQGGTVILATSAFDVELSGTLFAKNHDSGLRDWLAHHGIIIEKEMVLDPRNSAFPIPVERKVGGFIVRETQMINYPYFVDLRKDGIDQESGIASGINQVTLSWASPLKLDLDKEGKHVIRLLESSEMSWSSNSTNIQPDFTAHGPSGFPEAGDRGRKLVAAVVEGSFESYFKDRPNPLLSTSAESSPEEAAGQENTEDEENGDNGTVITRTINKSPDSARIILFSSNTFLTDTALSLASGALGTRYLNPVQLVANAVDWSLEDRDLLSIRGRGHFSRTLRPMDQKTHMFWEYLNYAAAAAGLAIIWFIRIRAARQAQNRYRVVLGQKGA